MLRFWHLLFDSTAFLTEFRIAMVLRDMDLWRRTCHRHAESKGEKPEVTTHFLSNVSSSTLVSNLKKNSPEWGISENIMASLILKTPSGKWRRCLWEYSDRESARDWFCGLHTWLWALISSTAQFQVKEAKAVLGQHLTWVLRAGSQNGVQWHFLGQQELTLFLNSERPVREDKGYLPSNT